MVPWASEGRYDWRARMPRTTWAVEGRAAGAPGRPGTLALHCTHCTAPAPWGLGLGLPRRFTDCVCDRTATMHHNACLAALTVVPCDGDWVGCKWSPGARYTTLCCSKGPQAQALGGRPHTTRRDPETPSCLASRSIHVPAPHRDNLSQLSAFHLHFLILSSSDLSLPSTSPFTTPFSPLTQSLIHHHVVQPARLPSPGLRAAGLPASAVRSLVEATGQTESPKLTIYLLFFTEAITRDLLPSSR